MPLTPATAHDFVLASVGSAFALDPYPDLRVLRDHAPVCAQPDGSLVITLRLPAAQGAAVIAAVAEHTTPEVGVPIAARRAAEDAHSFQERARRPPAAPIISRNGRPTRVNPLPRGFL